MLIQSQDIFICVLDCLISLIYLLAGTVSQLEGLILVSCKNLRTGSKSLSNRLYFI